ncbi:hypothetical protein EG19_07765 [Thermoanaerobaculum aquaticum]|uniref:ABC transporter domain-containing protein n=1 Tax=Thermoanaerobaculum aquaticum TaxID=1312852 RepID=A0A062XQK6_9BACT|nr:hypothetical protein EG19_07765 [Thermoanaerobaculum aquaticum]
MIADDIAVSVRDLGRVYRLYARPQDRLKHSLLWRFGRKYGCEFWALRNVSFDVRKGETFGIIGRNGAGKSTLLQIIAGILEPTVGQVIIRGRVASLLELGSGFNPEFTGRENILLNGAILGLSRAEVKERVEEIIAFADIGSFIDQPVKLYSSGMLMRLAFAVATHVEADVVVIDEVLAVGDVFFRQKCYQRLERLRQRKVTVLMASHAMTEVEQFCNRAILLDKGQVVFQGTASEAVKRYYLLEQLDRTPTLSEAVSPDHDTSAQQLSPGPPPWPTSKAFLDLSKVHQVSDGSAICTGVALTNSSGKPTRVFAQGEVAFFHSEFELLRDIEVPIGGVVIQNDKGIHVHGKNTLQYGSRVPRCVPRGSRLRFSQQITLALQPGEYTFEVGLATISGRVYDRLKDLTHQELRDHVFRLCHLSQVGPFRVTWRVEWDTTQLTHHGVADLPGECEVWFIPPSGSDLDKTNSDAECRGTTSVGERDKCRNRA